MKTSELAAAVGLSRSQVARLAPRIPGYRRTDGRHIYFLDCPALRQWIKNQPAYKRKLNVPNPVRPEPGILTPLRKALDYYTEDRLSRVDPRAGYLLIDLLKNAEAKLPTIRAALEKRFKSSPNPWTIEAASIEPLPSAVPQGQN